MTRVAILLLVLLGLAACGEGERTAIAPALPEDDPVHGIYNYDHAREVGIRDGFSAEELDTAEEVAAIEREMATAPTCIADPRLALIVVGYSVDAVRTAPSAYEKGKLICGGIAMSLPATDAEGFDRIARQKLRSGYGVDPSDSLEELVAGCRTTDWGADMLLPD